MLASLAAATGLTYLTSGCKLSFHITPSLSPSSSSSATAPRAAAGTDNPSRTYTSLDDNNNDDEDDESLRIDVFVIPGVPAEKLQTLLLEARDSLLRSAL